MRYFSKIAAAVAISLVFVATGLAQTKPQRPQIDVASINGREVYANSQVGSTNGIKENCSTNNFHGIFFLGTLIQYSTRADGYLPDSVHQHACGGGLCAACWRDGEHHSG